MNNEQLDKRFRELVQNDASDLNQAEQAAKEAVWQSLELPQSANTWRWKVAVGALLLLLGLVFGVLQNKINHQTRQAQQADRELRDTKDSLQQIVVQLQQVERQLKIASHEIALSGGESMTIIEYQDKYIDRIVEQHDTLLIEKRLLQAPNTIIIRDTVWIPTPTPVAIASTSAGADQEQQQPSKVEFLFNGNTSKQKYKIPIYINERAVVKKAGNGNQGIIKITVN